jgi:hypothetical protein
MIKAGQKRKSESARKPKPRSLTETPDRRIRKRILDRLSEDHKSAVSYLEAQRGAFESSKRKLGKSHPWDKMTWVSFLEFKFISEHLNRLTARRRANALESRLKQLQARLGKRRAEAAH